MSQWRSPWGQHAPQINYLGEVTADLQRKQGLAIEAHEDMNVLVQAQEQAAHRQSKSKRAIDPAELERKQRSVAQKQIVSLRNPRYGEDAPIESAVVYHDEERPGQKHIVSNSQERLVVGAKRLLSNQDQLSSGNAVVLRVPESTSKGQGSEAGWMPGVVETGMTVQPVDMVPGSPGRVLDQRSYFDTGEPAETITPDRMTEPGAVVYPGDYSSAAKSRVRTFVDAQNAAYPDDGESMPGFPGKTQPPASWPPVEIIPAKGVPDPAAPWVIPGLVLPEPTPIGPATGNPLDRPNNGWLPPGAVDLQPPPSNGDGGGVQLVPTAPAKEAGNRWWVWALLAGAVGVYVWRRKE